MNKNIINSLPKPLQEELITESYGNLLSNFKMLVKNFSEDSLIKTVKIIKEIKYSPGDIIYLVNFLFSFFLLKYIGRRL